MYDLIRASRSSVIASTLLLSLSLGMPIALAEESEPHIDWVRQFGTSGSDKAAGAAADTPTSTSDEASNYSVGTVAGTFPGQTSAGGSDAYLRKYNIDGTEEWTIQFGTAGDDRATAVTINPNGTEIYVLGTTDGAFAGYTNAGGRDAFIRKYNDDGTIAWTHQFGTDGEEEFGSIAFTLGGVVAGGRTSGALPGLSNAGGYDALVYAVSHDGINIWTDTMGSSGNDSMAYTDAIADGVSSFAAASVISPLPGQTGIGGSDIAVRKYDNSGVIEWTQTVGTTSDDDGVVLSQHTSTTNIAARTTGAAPGETNAGGIDVIHARIDPSGTLEWLRQFGTSGDDIPLWVDSGGSNVNSYVAGTTTGTFNGETSAGGTDAFIAKFDYQGLHLWKKQFGTAGIDTANGSTLTHSQNQISFSAYDIYVSGETDGVFTGEASAGASDAYHLRIEQDEDNDFIYNTIDGIPENYSDVFTDGNTEGAIVDRGGQTLVLVDGETEDDGVSVAAIPGGPPEPAQITICDETATADLDPGDVVDVKCGSAIISVKEGDIEATFQSEDGTFTATSSFDAGNTVRFAGATNELTTPATNVDPVTVSIGAVDHVLVPGRKLVILNAESDTFVREGAENRNEGGNGTLVVRKQGDIRSLIRFDLSGVPLAGLQKATLVLTVNPTNAPDNWGPNGRLLDASALTQSWTEGNGKDLDLPEQESTRGTGAGATWDCATDTDISNTQSDCSTEWNGATSSAQPRTAQGFLMKNNFTGQATWNVTQDVLTGASHGWMITRREPNKSGNVRFYSREGANGNDNITPQLVLEYENP